MRWLIQLVALNIIHCILDQDFRSRGPIEYLNVVHGDAKNLLFLKYGKEAIIHRMHISHLSVIGDRERDTFDQPS